MRTSTKHLLTGLLMAALGGALLGAPAADGHYKGQKYWYFGGGTYTEDLSERKDPVNIMFYPYGVSKTVLDEHFNAHWRPEWFEHESLTEGPYNEAMCRGDQRMGFKRSGGGAPGYVATSFHGAGAGQEGRCFNRYHVRFWRDDYHEQVSETNHSNRDSWVVGGIHYEELRPLHEPARDWDQVEWYAVTHRSKLRAHSSNYRWRVLPFSRGRFQNFVSDGRITRVSAQRHG